MTATRKTPAPARTSDAGRAVLPSESGLVPSPDGVRIAYEVYGSGEPTLVLLPSAPIVHSRQWKGQVPYLSRHYRVVTYDGRGNGQSDRPTEPEAYHDDRSVDDLEAIMDATSTTRAVLVGLCGDGVWRSIRFAAAHPERVLGIVGFAVGVPLLSPPQPGYVLAGATFEDELPAYEGWAKMNRHYWERDWPGFAEFFFTQICNQPHSTKLIEDMVGFACESTAGVQLAEADGDLFAKTSAEGEALLARVRCPVLVVHGTEDRCQPYARGAHVAELTGGRLVTLEGAGHVPQGREPVLVNLLLREFVEQVTGTTRPRRWTRALDRRPRVLYLSSPIGLGHARRDLAIVQALRTRRPDVQVDWLTQEPVVTFLESQGERVHPASSYLSSESRHIESLAGEHDLHAFQAIRNMDEILVANFMVFNELVTDEHYDLWVGDEAWDVDHFLHENPELKRTAFAWMTDFVGWLPMPSGGEREAFLTADYNAEMLEHVERFPRIRDRSIFVGDPDDIVPDDFGPGLPSIRDWTERHYAFSGYVTGFDPAPLIERREELRRELGYHPDERVVIVTVGGSGVGEALLRRVIASYPDAARRVNGLRMIAVAGPRIDPAILDAPSGVEVRAFVPELYRHLAVCDLAVVQGGLTTTMELAAARRPFLYFPLRDHFEQNRHVRHRLERYGAGRYMDYDASPPEVIAEAIVSEIDRPVDYRPVESDGAARAAALIAPLI